MASTQQLKDLGESEILRLLHRFCPPEVIGDDGAVVLVRTGYSLVVTTDVLVDGVHFGDRTTPAAMVGWRAVAANLSDLAAMGATPTGITVALSLPPETDLAWLEALYAGMADCLQTYNTPLVGGDLTRSPVKTIAITAFGEVLPHQVISRRAAQVGDAIVVTGFHGDAQAGLELLLHPEKSHNLSPEEQRSLILAHQKPLPRLDVAAFLRTLAIDRPIAGMDSSDGLADAVLQICQMSGVGAELDQAKIPVSPALRGYKNPRMALNCVLYGGEDFQLVLCLPRSLAELLTKEFGETCAIIGEITAEKSVAMIIPNGDRQLLSRSQTFQHF